MTSKEALEIIGNINLGNNPYCVFEDDKLKNCINEEYNIIKKDLERLEEFEKVLNGHCSKCVNRENNICVGMDAPIHIDTLINCIEMENQELKDENNKLKKALKIIMKWRKSQMYDLMQNLEDQNIEGFEILEEVLCE